MSDWSFTKNLFEAHRRAQRLPSPDSVCSWLNGLLGTLFPELSNTRYLHQRELELHYEQLRLELFRLLATMEELLPQSAKALEEAFMQQIPVIHRVLQTDAAAMLSGDPAAVDLTEVIRTYPGFRAMAVFRMAHAFHSLHIPLIPRILTEHAHGLTGIDIHPGATIGEAFCIDHGTGLVIGETVNIGNNVKIYQGVTLGALSVDKAMAQTKRHPTIEDDVVIYAGATILGGRTVIGQGSIIGGNVWITRSVPAHSRVYYEGGIRQEISEPNT